MNRPDILESGLSGAEIIDRLRCGHVVRRACWVDSVFIRVTNEQGIGEDGYIIFDETDHLYTISTEGHFLHLGSSSQPFRSPRGYWGGQHQWQVATRDGEGIGMLFANDWENYGLMTREEFHDWAEEVSEEVREDIRESRRIAIEKAKSEKND